MKLPTKPTSKTWNRDARALLSMGCSQVDAATLHGVLSELDALRSAARAKIEEVYEGPCITEADQALIDVLAKIDE